MPFIYIHNIQFNHHTPNDLYTLLGCRYFFIFNRLTHSSSSYILSYFSFLISLLCKSFFILFKNSLKSLFKVNLLIVSQSKLSLVFAGRIISDEIGSSMSSLITPIPNEDDNLVNSFIKSSFLEISAATK